MNEQGDYDGYDCNDGYDSDDVVVVDGDDVSDDGYDSDDDDNSD